VKLDGSRFVYNATIKLGELPRMAACTAFPGVTEIGVSSRDFGSYSECVISARILMDDIIKDVNTVAQTEQLALSSEVNPRYTGVDTRSQDWEPMEVSRFWIFTADQAGAQRIHAVVQARIFSLRNETPVLSLN
jgi:hypothetical protein